LGISAQWDNEEKTIILVTIDSEWTWADLIAIDAQTTAMYESVGHTVDLVVDARQNKLVLTGFLSYARSLLDITWHPLAGNAVVFGAGSRVQALFDAAALVAGKRFERVRFVESLDEARALLKQMSANR
jgi:hypothetical protein